MEYLAGPFLDSDAKRLKRIKSLVKDVEAHHKFLVGKIWELNNSPKYHVPTSKAQLYEYKITETECVRIHKFRQVTTNPRSDVSGGLRIVALMHFVEGVASRYTPILVYSASEEDTSIPFDGSKFKMTKSGISELIKYRLAMMAE